MAETPDLVAAIGPGAEDRLLNAAKSDLARALRAQADQIRQQVSRAQVKASGVSMATAVGPDRGYTGWNPRTLADDTAEIHQELSALPINPASIPNQRGREAAAAQVEARRQEVAEASERTATALKSIVPVASAVTTALAFVARTANSFEAGRGEAAKEVGAVRQSIAESVQALGGTAAQAGALTKRAEAGQFGAMTPQSVAKVLAARASYARANPLAPLQFDETVSIIEQAGRQNISEADAMSLVSQPLPGVAAALQGVQRRGGTSFGTRTIRGRAAGREQDVYVAGAKQFEAGQDRLDEEARIRALGLHDVFGKAGETAYHTFGNVLPKDTSLVDVYAVTTPTGLMYEAVKALKSFLAPPSTTAGR